LIVKAKQLRGMVSAKTNSEHEHSVVAVSCDAITLNRLRSGHLRRKRMKTSLITKLGAGLPVLAAAAALVQSPSALAGPAIGLDPTGTGTYNPATSYSDLWTNNTDSALAVGFNPGVIIPPNPYDIQLIAQARVSVLNLGANVVTPIGMAPGLTAAQCSLLGGCFELTKVLNINEKVIANDGTNANFGNTAQTADVDTNTPGLQQLAIYIDPLTDTLNNDPNRAIPGDGFGTVSGYTVSGGDPTPATLILSAHVVSNVSSFAASGAVGTGSFDLRFQIDYVDPSYLDIATNSIIGDKITGTTNVPTQFNPAVMWEGTATGTGLLLKVDSSEDFRSAVPEPATIALMGAGLLGASFARRRRGSAKA
jgi:hypothetical protein